MPAEAAPRIETNRLLLELGELTAGETAELEFPLVNTGTEPLRIERVIASCGCTTASHPRTLKPGEKGVLKINLVSHPLWSGPVEKQITVVSNDPEQPSLNLQIVARMRPLFHYAPRIPIGVNYKKGDVIRQVLTVTSATNPPTEVIRVVADGAGTEARLLPAESSDRPGVARVEIVLRPPEQGGDFTRFITLQTTHSRVPAIAIPIAGVSEDAISVSPPLLRLEGLSAGADTGKPRPIILYKRGGSFRVLEVRTDTPALQAELSDAFGTDLYEISIRYLGGWKKGKSTGKIVIVTDNAAAPRLEVPYVATIE